MIESHSFGQTGHVSTRTLFGAAALSRVTQDEADRTLEMLLKYEINHIDTAAGYGDAELRIGPWMQSYRKNFFLATKTGERTYQKARDEIHHSLERMRVEQVDLLQLHYLVDREEWKVAMGSGGALEAAIEARDQGLTRFIGVTGHGWEAPSMHLRSLEHFDFDSVLLPYSYILMQNAEYAADFAALLAVCQERKIAVQTIKSICRRPWGDRPRTRATWYEPLGDQPAIDANVHWVLSQPGIFLNTVGDIQELPKVLDAASRFEGAPSDDEMRQVIAEQEMVPLFA